MDKNLIVSFHVQSVDQMQAIKLVKSKVTDINKMKIEEQKKRFVPDMIWIFCRQTLRLMVTKRSVC